jgi:hypothetical protein
MIAFRFKRTKSAVFLTSLLVVVLCAAAERLKTTRDTVSITNTKMNVRTGPA